jgi:hypothetical protein
VRGGEGREAMRRLKPQVTDGSQYRQHVSVGKRTQDLKLTRARRRQLTAQVVADGVDEILGRCETSPTVWCLTLPPSR